MEVLYPVLEVTSLEWSQSPCLDQLVIRSLWSYKFVGFLSSPKFMIPTSVYRWREGKQSPIFNPQPMVDWWLKWVVNHPKNPSWRKYCWNINLKHQPSRLTEILSCDQKKGIHYNSASWHWVGGVGLASCPLKHPGEKNSPGAGVMKIRLPRH